MTTKPDRRTRLKDAEDEIFAFLEAYNEASYRNGLALKEILDEKLFKEDGCKTFASCCRRWLDIAREAHRLIVSAVRHRNAAEMRSAPKRKGKYEARQPNEHSR